MCPSVRPYICQKCVDCDKTEDKSVPIFVPYERSFSLVYSEEKWLVGRPLLPEILSQLVPVGAIAIGARHVILGLI